MKKATRFVLAVLFVAAFAMPQTACNFFDSRINRQTENYTVTFIADEETHDTQTVKSGNNVTYPAEPEKTGMRFVGWSLKANDYSPLYVEYPILGDLNLYAYFVDISTEVYTVSFDTNGAAEKVKPIKIANGNMFCPPSVNLTNKGSLFYGWSTEKGNPKTALYAINANGFSIAKDVTLYALWAKTGDEHYTNRFLLNALYKTMRDAIGFYYVSPNLTSNFEYISKLIYSTVTDYYIVSSGNDLITKTWGFNDGSCYKYVHDLTGDTYTKESETTVSLKSATFFGIILQLLHNVDADAPLGSPENTGFTLKQGKADTYTWAFSSAVYDDIQLDMNYEIVVKSGKIKKLNATVGDYLPSDTSYEFYFTGETVPIPPLPDYEWVSQ